MSYPYPYLMTRVTTILTLNLQVSTAWHAVSPFSHILCFLVSGVCVKVSV